MTGFREGLAQFRDAIHHAGGQNGSPGLQAILERERLAKTRRLRRAVAVALVLVLGAIPIYRNAQQGQREAGQAAADELLLKQVNAALSRSAPRAMEPLDWTPANVAK